MPPGTRVYAVGDCHGGLEALRGLRQAIVADSAKSDPAWPGTARPCARRQVVVYLGDYLDRGPDSRGVIDLLTGEPLAGFESVHLLGNHELFMRRFLDGTDDASAWIINGGDATLRSYGLDAAAQGAGQGTALGRAGDDAGRLRDALTLAVPEAHRAFLDGLALSHVEGDYFFAHAGVRPGVPLAAQEADDLLWIREPFLGSTADHGKVVVHGHSVVAKAAVRPNRIGIDTGACFGGKLTALVLEGAERRFLQV